MLTPDQLADLRAAAEAATPGPWTQRGIALIEAKTGELSRASIAEVFHAAEDADYIAAANPAAVLALLTHIDAQAARIAELERDAARYYLIRDWLVAQQKGFVHYIGVAVSEVLATDMPTEQMLNEIDAAIDAAMEQQCTS
ncbi:ead/Ea22-like family protein [Chromobacterium phragmitis]|uniref:ead/Ea22-like family protein n=1 Tax=Chromobacterium amazonense TaxID=1382803 RepID=UPI0021B7B47E|nr:ead/Ea22-like family protein [Chromobacterium amazonense]MBM2884046.1 ead/Ea22-like family protein [Chromobacterium amazonense]